jgi:hypothetical protein
MAPPAAEPKNRETGGHYAVTIDSLIPSSHPSTKPGQVQVSAAQRAFRAGFTARRRLRTLVRPRGRPAVTSAEDPPAPEVSAGHELPTCSLGTRIEPPMGRAGPGTASNRFAGASPVEGSLASRPEQPNFATARRCRSCPSTWCRSVELLGGLDRRIRLRLEAD